MSQRNRFLYVCFANRVKRLESRKSNEEHENPNLISWIWIYLLAYKKINSYQWVPMGSSEHQIQLGQEIGRIPWKRAWRHRRLCWFYRCPLEEAAGRLDGWVRVNKVEGILKAMETITKGSQVFWWKVEVFPFGSFYFLYKVRNEMLYQNERENCRWVNTRRGLRWDNQIEGEPDI